MFLLQYILLKFFILGKGEELAEVLGVALRSWITTEDDGSIGCLWPPEEPTFEEMMMLLRKKIQPQPDWKKHSCQIIKTYSESTPYALCPCLNMFIRVKY